MKKLYHKLFRKCKPKMEVPPMAPVPVGLADVMLANLIAGRQVWRLSGGSWGGR